MNESCIQSVTVANGNCDLKLYDRHHGQWALRLGCLMDQDQDGPGGFARVDQAHRCSHISMHSRCRLCCILLYIIPT